MATIIREAADEDAAAIHTLLIEAFEGPDEARLVAALDADEHMLLSLVAENGGALIGHVGFSTMDALADGKPIAAAALAPIAVAEPYRGHGIASTLIEQGLAEIEDRGIRIVFVLGDEAFYTRFGFEAELAARFASPYSSEHWLALALGDTPRIRRGEAHHAPAFSTLDG
ncbi:N-acetyltransferase [Sphingomonas sp. 1P06PA]|uniref:GNAT family N-acetyltransferase n=1 Tax=Sphingomonas sp. 1P06PA TaxID=554121 RepID=UPI0039A49BA9